MPRNLPLAAYLAAFRAGEDANPLFSGRETVTSSGVIPLSYCGKLVEVTSASDVVLTLPSAEAMYSAGLAPICIYRSGNGLVTLDSTDTLSLDPSKIRNVGGTIIVIAISATEFLCIHDGPAASIWELQ